MCIIFLGFDDMTLELLCQIDRPYLASLAEISPLLDLLVALQGFDPVAYDLNQHESWRAFDPHKAAVDLLTQRIELLRVRGSSASSLAMISRGGADEAPAMMMCTLDTSEVGAVREALLAHLPPLATLLKWLVVTSTGWREQALASPHLRPLLQERTPPLSPILARKGEHHHHAPSPHFTHHSVSDTSTPFTLHVLARDLRIDDDAHARQLAAFYASLSSA